MKIPTTITTTIIIIVVKRITRLIIMTIILNKNNKRSKDAKYMAGCVSWGLRKGVYGSFKEVWG